MISRTSDEANAERAAHLAVHAVATDHIPRDDRAARRPSRARRPVPKIDLHSVGSLVQRNGRYRTEHCRPVRSESIEQNLLGPSLGQYQGKRIPAGQLGETDGYNFVVTLA